jgi:hypothetical protein
VITLHDRDVIRRRSYLSTKIFVDGENSDEWDGRQGVGSRQSGGGSLA